MTSIETRLGEIVLEGGYPDARSLETLIDELDHQRACQAYLWGLPIVGLNEWRKAHDDVFKVRPGQFVSYITFEQKLGILTPNFETPYLVAHADLATTGPLILELPKGLIAGMVLDAWQRSLTDLGLVGPDRGLGGRYLLLGPDHEEPEADGFIVIRSTTRKVLFGGRLLEPDAERAFRELGPEIRAYPWAERATPPEKAPMAPAGTSWSQTPPTGMAYWESLADALFDEPVQERDRFFMAMLKPLGIEKGKAFTPDARQQKILTDGALSGQLLAKANTYTKRFADPYWPGSRWKDILAVNTTQRAATHEQLDERASWFYEAVVISEAMRSRIPGFGQRYLGAYQDHDGNWLVGDHDYRLRVPADAPVTQFWSVTIYDEKNRQMLVNETKNPDVSSREKGVVQNADGTTDVYVGPTAPEGLTDNWVQTSTAEGWFALFRFYGPTEAMLDGTWVLPDFERQR